MPRLRPTTTPGGLSQSAMRAGALPHPDHIAEIHRRLVALGGESGVPDYSRDAIARVTAEVYGNMDHPLVPGLKVKEVPAYERVAWMMNDRRPSAKDVQQAAQTLKHAGISPSDFESTWSIARPVANRLLNGRDPTIVQLQHLVGKNPHEVHDYYMHHPYPGYEEVTAGDMARYYRAAEAISRQYGHRPNFEEVSRFAVAGYTADDMHDHYGS